MTPLVTQGREVAFTTASRPAKHCGAIVTEPTCPTCGEYVPPISLSRGHEESLD